MNVAKQAKVRRAYVTFLAADGDYVNGVVGLAKGLRKVKSVYTLVVAVLPDVPNEHPRILESQGCIVREIEPIFLPENQTKFAMSHYVINYSKLRIWEFAEYKKMIYIDGDIQVFDNIYSLFDLPDGHLYAVSDCFCKNPWSHTRHCNIGYCHRDSERETWPSRMGPPPSPYFNAGFLVFKPSRVVYDDILEKVKTTPPTSFAEQGHLQAYPSSLQSNNAIIVALPEKIELDEAKVVHYCADGAKPWRYTGKEDYMDREDVKMLVMKWWDIYDDESLDYKALSVKDRNRSRVADQAVNLEALLDKYWKSGSGSISYNLQC
ncbi:hypothetical protein GIB67_021965 [Kingdonia uniflora]|uniref:Hexosyltransferase n=1 Tax=Kingdonia uniflora TaxID=39325 RepID=A0A7J7P7R1_9MAGN|nr:hypothetical protein GIB67_021965 [Kingdonia uniflora]